MKKIIFDLDNTLMMFNDSYLSDYSSIINGTYEDGLSLYKSIGKYEAHAGIYNKKELLRFINKDMSTNYTMELFDKLLDAISNNWIYSVPEGAREVLNYLHSRGWEDSEIKEETNHAQHEDQSGLALRPGPHGLGPADAGRIRGSDGQPAP